MLKGDDEGKLLWLVGGAEYRRVFGLLVVAGFGEDGGARESFSASDNSAMLRLCRGALGDASHEPLLLAAGMMFSFLLLNVVSDAMFGETLCVFMPSSALGVLLNIEHPMNVDPTDCLEEVGVVLVVEERGVGVVLVDERIVLDEESGVRKALTAKAVLGVNLGELLDLLSDADDIILSELLPSFFSTFSSFTFLPSSFPMLSSFCFPPISIFFASSKFSFSCPSSSSWSQIMDASMLLRCSDPGEDAGLSDAHPDPGEAVGLDGDVHLPNGVCPPLLLGPGECPYKGRAGEDRVALRVEGFDLGPSNLFSLRLSTVLDDFFKDASSLGTSPFRWGTHFKGLIPGSKFLEDASSRRIFGESTSLPFTSLI